MQPEAVISAPLGALWFDDEGLLHFKGNANARSVSNIQEHFAVTRHMLMGRRVCLLADLEDTAPMNSKERELMLAELQNTYKAIAIVPNSPLGKVHATAFTVLKKPLFPGKMFDREEEARRWLRQYL